MGRSFYKRHMKLKILVLALSGIGDALMFTPALLRLMEKNPSAEIDILVMFKGARDIYQRIPGIANVHYYDFINSNSLSTLKYVLSLRKKYNATINVYPSNRKEYNIISFLLGAKKRAAVNYLRKDFANLGFLNNVTIIEDDSLHNVEENIKLCEKLLGESFGEIPPLQINFNEEEISFEAKYLHKQKISRDDLVIGFHPGCAVFKNHINRRWEPGNFAELGKRLIEKQNAKVLLFGGPDESNLREEIVDKIDSDNAISVETDSLLKSVAVMKRCNVFVTNDSALMHIASALKLNVVAIIGPTNTNYIRPWQTEHKIATLNLDCAPCFYYSPKPLTCTRVDVQYKCIKELSVDIVYNEVKKFLA